MGPKPGDLIWNSYKVLKDDYQLGFLGVPLPSLLACLEQGKEKEKKIREKKLCLACGVCHSSLSRPFSW